MKSRLLLSLPAIAITVSSASAADQVRWLNDWLPAGDAAPIYYGVASGIFADAGIDLTIETARGSSEVVTRLATGSADFGFAGIAALMQARVEGDVPVTAVMSIFNTPPDAIVTVEGSGIETFVDLPGKTIATAAFSSSNVIWPLVLELNGLNETDIELQKVDPGALGPMLATGQVDGTISWLPTAVGFEGAQTEAGKTIKLLPWSEFGFESYGASVIASDALIAENPELVTRFVGAYKASVEAAAADPEAAVAALKQAVPEVDAELGVKQLTAALSLIINERSAVDGLGSYDPDRLASTWALVSKAQGLAEDALDPETVVDRSFVAAASE